MYTIVTYVCVRLSIHIPISIFVINVIGVLPFFFNKSVYLTYLSKNLIYVLRVCYIVVYR